MKKIFLMTAFSAAAFTYTAAQVSTAQDFTMSSCDGNTHSLFADHLDNGQVVIMEFFMTCSSCQQAAARLTPMHTSLNTAYPGMVSFFVLAYTNSYTCTTVNNWKTSNAPNAVPFDSGAVQVAYYGGFAMPTVVVVGGPQHQVLYNSNYDGAPGDTAAIRTAIEAYFQTMGMENAEQNIQFKAYPNPVADMLTIELELGAAAQVQLDMADVNGRMVRTISNDMLPAGKQQLQVNTSGLPDGIYFIRLERNGKVSQYSVSVKH